MKKNFKHFALAVLVSAAALPIENASGANQKPSTEPRLWGCVASANSWTKDDKPYGLYRISAGSPIRVEKIFNSDACLANGGARVHDGRYGVTFYDAIDLSYGIMYTYYYEYDYTSGEQVFSRQEISNTLAAVETAQYEATGDVYGVFYNSNMDGLEYGKINYDGFTRSTISSANHYYLALGISSGKDLYGVATDGNLYKIDIYDGSETLVGATGVDNLCDDSGNYRQQSGEIDQKSDTFYWNAVDTNGNSALYTVDLTTGKATKIGDMPDGEVIVGMCIPPIEDQGDGPARIADLSADFPEGGDDGTVTFTAPTKTMNGDDITGTLTYTVGMNYSKAASGTTQPGAKVSVAVSGTEGTNIITAKVASDKGACPEAQLLKYVGFDTPVPVGNIAFNYSNATGQATVTWDAPEKGTHDGYLGELKYDVVRYPEGVKVASDITARSFSEPLSSADNSAFYYGITAKNGIHESDMAKSRTQTVGPGFTVPYSADLSSRDVFNTFTVVDCNNDGKTWTYGKVDDYGTSDKYSAVSMYSIDNDADDWLITPPILLEKGKEYEVSFTAQSAYSKFDQKMEVKFGVDAIVDEMTNQLFETMTLPGEPTEYKARIAPTADGKVYIGFHDVSDRNMFRIALHSVAVNMATPTGITAVGTGDTETGNVYSLDGRLVAKGINGTRSLKNGVYVVDGKKLVIR